MVDPEDKLSQQITRAEQIDEEARDLYKTSFLILSVVVAAVSLNIQLTEVFEVLLDTGLSSSGIGDISTWYLLILWVAILLVYTAAFAIVATGILIYFFVTPYYAIRSVNAAPIENSDSFPDAFLSDLKRMIPARILNKLTEQSSEKSSEATVSEIGLGQNGIVLYPRNNTNIYSTTDAVIHNERIIRNKSLNLEKSKANMLNFFVCIIGMTGLIGLLAYL